MTWAGEIEDDELDCVRNPEREADNARAPKCEHEHWVWQRQCADCGIAEGPFEDVDRRPLI